MTNGSDLGNDKERSLPQLIIIIVLAVIAVPATVYAVNYVIEIRSKAGPSDQPQNVQVSNVTDAGATITWTTPANKTIGYVKYGTSADTSEIAFDSRDTGSSTTEYTIHTVTLENLSAETLYYYKIVIGDQEFQNGTIPYELKTGKTLEAIPTPRPIIGEVEDPYSSDEEFLVTIYIKSSDTVSNKLSVITKDNKYNFDLANLRLEDLSMQYVNFDGSQMYLTAEGGGIGTGTIITDIIEL
jgi:hypothetical protein